MNQSKINFSAFPSLSILYLPKVHMISNIWVRPTRCSPTQLIWYFMVVIWDCKLIQNGAGPARISNDRKKISIRNGFNSDFQNPFRIFFLFRWSLDFDFLEMIITISLQTIEWSRDLTVAINHIWYHKDTAIINFW